MKSEIIGRLYSGNDLFDTLNNYPSRMEKIRFVLFCTRDAEHSVKNPILEECNNTVEEYTKNGEIAKVKKLREKIKKLFPKLHKEEDVITKNLTYLCFDLIDYVIGNRITEYLIIRVVSFASLIKALSQECGNNRITEGYYYEFRREHDQVAKSWGIVWKNPSKNLLAISDSCEFDQIFFDLIQDEREMCDVIIPYNGIKYYLNIHGYKDRFVGTSQEEVIEKVTKSSRRNFIVEIIKNMIRERQDGDNSRKE